MIRIYCRQVSPEHTKKWKRRDSYSRLFSPSVMILCVYLHVAGKRWPFFCVYFREKIKKSKKRVEKRKLSSFPFFFLVRTHNNVTTFIINLGYSYSEENAGACILSIHLAIFFLSRLSSLNVLHSCWRKWSLRKEKKILFGIRMVIKMHSCKK